MNRPVSAPVRTLLPPVLAWTGLWLLLSGGAADSWLVGVPAILAATWAGRRLAPSAPPRRLRPGALPAFAARFLFGSLRGGIDVARRALAPHPRLAPVLVEYRITLPPGPPRVLLLLAVSLMPGTLSTRLAGDRVRIHVLDRALPVRQELDALQRHVAALFESTDPRGGAA